MYPSVTFNLHRVPFLLEPGYHAQPPDFTESHTTRMIRKFGTLESFESYKSRHDLPGRGMEVGLDALGFVQSNLSRRVQSSTVDSHRLVQYVHNKHGEEAGEGVAAYLGREHFTNAGVLNDRNLLVRAAVENGCDEEDIKDFLASKRGLDEVMEVIDRLGDLGIHSIPTLLIGGEVVVGGAVEGDKVVEVVNKFIEGGGGLDGRRLFGDVCTRIV